MMGLSSIKALTNCVALVNECETNNGGCAQICTDRALGFTCACNEGFALNTDGASCDEIDPSCNDTCVDSNDGYCDDGGPNAEYSGCAFGSDCTDCGSRTIEDECETNNGGCSQICTDTLASFTCSCNEGFLLNADGTTCDEIPADAICTETCEYSNDGGCDDGGPGANFSLCDFGTDCRDCGFRVLVDECADNNGGCDQVCTDTPSSFECSCNEGFSLDSSGTNCNPLVNECETNNGGCAQNCTDLEVGFECTCNEGFLLDQTIKAV